MTTDQNYVGGDSHATSIEQAAQKGQFVAQNDSLAEKSKEDSLFLVDEQRELIVAQELRIQQLKEQNKLLKEQNETLTEVNVLMRGILETDSFKGLLAEKLSK